MTGDAVQRCMAGPLLDDIQTTATMLDPAQVDQADYHDDLIRLINSAFRTAKSRTDILNEEIRLPVDSRFSQHVNTGLGAFVLVLHGVERNEYKGIVGTISARCRAIKPASTNDEEDDLETKRNKVITADEVFSRFELGHASEPTVVFWEMKLLAVNPSLQRKGIAGWLIDALEAEIVLRCRHADDRHHAITHVVVLLTTIEELNGAFYRNKGYVIDSKRHHKAGVLNSQGAFTIVHMSKRIALV